MQAIKTRYIGPTDYRPSRIKASCEAGSIIIPWPYDLNVNDAHTFAAIQLIKKLNWFDADLIVHSGSLSDCYVHVLEYRR